MKSCFITFILLAILFMTGCENSIHFYNFENLREGEVASKVWIEKSFFKPNEEYYFVFMRLSKENYQRFLRNPEFFRFSINQTPSITEFEDKIK